MATWTLARGAGDSWIVPIVDGDGAPIAYDGSEPLAGDVWPGGERASLATLTPGWYDPISGLTSVSVTDVITAALDPSTYRVRLTVLDASGLKTYYLGSLQILAAPGSETEPPSYCTDDDLRDYAAWIDDLQSGSDQAGFARQRGRAREWLDEIILSRWKPIGRSQIGEPGYGAWQYYAATGLDQGPSKWLRDQLAANTLMIRNTTKEIVAKRALYLICRSQLGCNNDHPYQDLARSFRFESEELLKTYRAEIDINADGYADLWVNCGATSLR